MLLSHLFISENLLLSHFKLFILMLNLFHSNINNYILHKPAGVKLLIYSAKYTHIPEKKHYYYYNSDLNG